MPKEKCTGGCSEDLAICIMGTLEREGTEGPVEILHISGEVLVKTKEGVWLRATEGARIDKGMMIRTGPRSTAGMMMDDGSMVILYENTDLRIAELFRVQSKSTLSIVIELTKGIIFSDVTTRDGTKFEVDTAVSVSGVQGTKFEVSFDGATSETKVYEGDVEVTSKYGDSIILGPSEKVSVSESRFGQKEVFDQSAQDKWWEEAGGGTNCCAGFALLGAALGFAMLSARAKGI
ncbi:MAG: FecR family protein [Candidatus Bilamarchaeaceae archaeon]